MRNDLFISIVIPVYNNKSGLVKALSSITRQTYIKSMFEVIIVDNGSQNTPASTVKRFNDPLNIKFLKENDYLNSPYSARNRGIEKANGDVIALLDATCAPVNDWLSEGIKAIQEGADLVGGNVTFDITEKSSSGEIYDSLTNVRMKDTIETKGAAKTGNLFIHRRVIDAIGMFPEGLRSGGDVRWTLKATSAGFKLVYSEAAEVIIKPRGFKKLVEKQFRVGKGQPEIWKESGTWKLGITKKIILFWLPPNPLQIRTWIKKSGRSYLNKYIIQLFFVGWYLRLVNAAGNIKGLIDMARK